jgi:hypothetical protein
VKETPHNTLLDRETPQKAMSEGFGPQLDILTDMVNYTSNLIPRLYERSQRQLRDLIVCYTLLKQFAVMLDAVEVLLRVGAVTAAYVPARAAFEAALYIEWILVSDGEKKATYYYVGNVRAERKWGERVSKGSPESAIFAEDMKQLGVDLYSNRAELDLEGTKFIASANAVLAGPAFADANAAFDAWITARTKPGKRPPNDPHWYTVLGKPTIRSIAKELMRLPEYIVHYGKGSQVVHSSSTKDHMQVKSSGVAAHPIRNLAGVHYLLNFVLSNAMHTFMRTLAFYRSDELPRYSAKYIEDWRSAFTKIPSVKIETKETKRP